MRKTSKPMCVYLVNKSLFEKTRISNERNEPSPCLHPPCCCDRAIVQKASLVTSLAFRNRYQYHCNIISIVSCFIAITTITITITITTTITTTITITITITIAIMMPPAVSTAI